MNKWTEWEDDILKEKYFEFGSNILELLKRHSKKAIQNRAAALNIKSQARWTNEEVETLKKNIINGIDIPADIPELNKSQNAIRKMAVRLGLIPIKRKEWTDEEMSYLLSEYSKTGSNTIIPGKSKKAIKCMATRMGLSTPNNKVIVTKNGIFNSIKEFAVFLNTAYTTVTNLLNKYTPDEVIEYVATIKHGPKEEVYDHLERHFKSIKEMAAFYDLPKSTVYKRLSNGWTLEEALTIPKHMYIGEYRVAECLKRLNVKFYHNCSIKTIFKDLGIKIDWNEFLDSLQTRLGLAGINWSKSKIEKLRPDFTLYTDDDNKIRGVIEFDGRQHQNFVEFFFKTIEEFLRRSNADFVKQDFFEYMGIPMLRIRNDQVNMIDEMVEDFVTHPESYIHGHNTFLSEEEYWSILADQKAKIEAAFAA